MREHEVPTHVQAEDRVLLWLTFPQIVAVTAVCAVAYGAYRYAPFGPSEVRMAIAVLFGLIGLVAVVGKVGGRRLPLVAADLLKYRLGPRLHAGPVSQLVRAAPPAPPQPVSSGPGPLSLMAKRAGRSLGRLRKNRRKDGERRNGRMRWFGKRRGKDGGKGKGRDHRSETLETSRKKQRKPRRGLLAVVALVALAAVATVPQAVLADGHEPWRDEIDFEVPERDFHRRVFFEELTVSGDRAAVTLRAAADIDLRVRAFGGPEGAWLRFWGSAALAQGERVDYSLPLHGPKPSFTFSWEDRLGHAGAFTIDHDRIAYPLPEAEGELCNVRLTSVGWTPGFVSGVIESECVDRVREPVDLQTVAGHVEVSQTALMDAEVTAIAGKVVAGHLEASANVPFVANGETRFRMAVSDMEARHPMFADVTVLATLKIDVPPLTVLNHIPERTERRTQTVAVWRPGTSQTVSETVTVTNGDGTTTEHVVSATLSIPGETVHEQVTLTIEHPERVEAELEERSPVTGARDESMLLQFVVASDDPYRPLVLPEPEPEEPSAEQTQAGNALSDWFRILGWEWPW